MERQLTAELKKVRGKEGILFRLADAAGGQPEGTVRTALYSVVGEKTLRDLVAEAKANDKAFKAKVRATLRSSYSSYYRQMLPPLLNTLGFKCNNTAYRPVMDALALLEKYADVDASTTSAMWCPWTASYARTGARPWSTTRAASSASRTSFACWWHCGTRSAAGSSTSRVGGGGATRRTTCPAISSRPAPCITPRSASPRTPKEFVGGLKRRMTDGLDRLSAGLADGSAGGVKITARKGEPWITVPKLEPLDEPTGLQALRTRPYGAGACSTSWTC
ncbi:hypothetical protein ACIOWI_36950 [Streptomyces sp. NPDC087659]|uniref:hypothetical protein n=1 Tax=Streptomyces sp. NPDC087659 TaxID=3365801 RepID=UPI003821EF7D